MAELQPFQQRVVAERDELAERTQKLLDFLDTLAFAKLGRAEQGRLRHQAAAMTEYGNVLAERIAHFTSPDDELIVFWRAAVPTDADPMCSRVCERVAMDVRDLGTFGIRPVDRLKIVQSLQIARRRDLEAEGFEDVVLL